MKKFGCSFIAALLCLSGCAGEPSLQVQAMQKRDKQLNCKEVLLEMNEAQFYMKAAQKNKGPKLKTILMPLGYISTYMDAQEAIDAASARVDYLDKVYNIMNCEAEQELFSRQQGYAPISDQNMYMAPPSMLPPSPAPMKGTRAYLHQSWQAKPSAANSSYAAQQGALASDRFIPLPMQPAGNAYDEGTKSSSMLPK